KNRPRGNAAKGGHKLDEASIHVRSLLDQFSAAALVARNAVMATVNLDNDVPPENVIIVPPNEVSAQWGKFPPGMTAPPGRADWFYVTGSEEEAEHIESFGLPAVCHKELGPKQTPILQNADLVLLNRGRELDATLAAVARQVRVVTVPDLTGCSKDKFIQLTKPHWERRAEARKNFSTCLASPTHRNPSLP